MIKPIEYHGLWWLPGKPEDKICGTLRFAPRKEILLDLLGTISSPNEHFNEVFRIDIIHGISAEGKKITLHKCYEKTCFSHSPGFPTSSYGCRYIYVGTHFNDSDNIKFKEVYISYSHLDEWINISGFEISPPADGTICVKYKKPEAIKKIIKEDLNILIILKIPRDLYLEKCFSLLRPFLPDLKLFFQIG